MVFPRNFLTAAASVIHIVGQNENNAGALIGRDTLHPSYPKATNQHSSNHQFPIHVHPPESPRRSRADICLKLRQHFLDVDLDGGSLSSVDEFYSQLESHAKDMLDQIVEKRSADLKAQMEQLRKDAEKTKVERISAINQLKQASDGFRKLRNSLTSFEKELKALDEQSRA